MLLAIAHEFRREMVQNADIRVLNEMRIDNKVKQEHGASRIVSNARDDGGEVRTVAYVNRSFTGLHAVAHSKPILVYSSLHSLLCIEL